MEEDKSADFKAESVADQREQKPVERQGADDGQDERGRPRQEGKESKEHSPDKADAEDTKEAADKKDKKKAKGSSSAKLAFLEQKYKEVYAENTARKDEVKSLASLVTDFLKEIDVGVNETEEYHLGDVKALRAAYVDGWIRFRKKAEVERRKCADDARAREKLLEEQVEVEKAEATRKKELGAKEAREQSAKAIKNLEDLSAKLQRDYNSLLSVLKVKESEISEVRKANLELSNKAADSLMDRFEKLQQNDISSKLDQSTKLGDIIRLKNELDQAYERVKSLEQHVAKLNQRRRKMSLDTGSGPIEGLEPSEMDGECFDKETQTVGIESFDDSQAIKDRFGVMDTPPAKKQERLEERLRREICDKRSEEEESSKMYLKNLVVKYIIYEARRNEDECSILRRAILDCLKVDSSDRATIDDAISNRGGLKDSIYFLKIFGGNS